jgi:hypothetical protein
MTNNNRARRRPAQFPRVPYGQIEWFLGRVHVGTSYLAVARNMRQRMNPAMTKAERREVYRYALAVHRANRALYAAVTSGRLA